MAWVRVDDQVPRHEKFLKAGPAASWLWVCGLAHSQAQLTDGFISDIALPTIGVLKGYKDLAQRLVEVGLWERVGDGFVVHDYLDHNDSRSTVLEKRAADAARKRKQSGDGTPDGISAESSAPRARVPSHPIPSGANAPDRASAVERRTSERRSGGVTAGQLPRDHAGHGYCDDTFSRCVPMAVHNKLADLLAPRHAGDRDTAKQALEAWYPTVCATLAADFVMGDAFRFWQSRFDAAFATKDTAPAGRKADEVRSTVPGVEETRRYLQQQRVAR